MNNTADLVIIGAGIVGCSAAYFLSKRGWKNIIVLDQGPLFKTGGSTSHAPGLVFQLNSSKTVSQLAKWSVEAYRELEFENTPCFYSTGSIEIATTSERWLDLKQKYGRALSWNLEAELINPDDVKTQFPLIDTSRILGGLHVPSDGIAKAVRAASALANRAQDTGGVEFYGHTPVMEIIVQGKKIRGVVTPTGTISTSQILLCAGIWGPKVGRLAGLTIPLTPVQHQYVKTTKIPELRGETREAVLPLLRYQDRSLYFRQEEDRIGIGSYQHEPLLVDPEKLDGSATRPFTHHHFNKPFSDACEILPCLRKVDLAEKFNGMFSFTPDGNSLIGESTQIKGFWMAEAVWVTHAAGVGHVIADLLSEITPSIDLREVDCNRFAGHVESPAYRDRRGAQQYREVYDIMHPLQPIDQPRPLRTSPVFLRHQQLGAFFRDLQDGKGHSILNLILVYLRTSGLAAPDGPPDTGHLSSVRSIRPHVRKYFPFDLSAFTKLELKACWRRSSRNTFAPISWIFAPGRMSYTPLLNSSGGIMSDLTVTRWDHDHFT